MKIITNGKIFGVQIPVRFQTPMSNRIDDTWDWIDGKIEELKI